jgi:uncharacterized protein
MTLRGSGIGLRAAHHHEILERERIGVDFVEVISEECFDAGGIVRRVLEKTRAEVPIAMHGVSLAIAGPDPISERYLEQLERTVRWLEPSVVSDHLCAGLVSGKYAHDLWPVPNTREIVGFIAARVSKVQDRLGRKILLENISSYVRLLPDDAPEHEILIEVARRSGAGILLDVNNVFVNANNHGLDPGEYLDAIPADLVEQIHLAGHTARGELLIDTHIGPVPAAVWSLYQRLVRRIGPRPALVEWDDEIPALEVVLKEAERARS